MKYISSIFSECIFLSFREGEGGKKDFVLTSKIKIGRIFPEQCHFLLYHLSKGERERQRERGRQGERKRERKREREIIV